MGSPRAALRLPSTPARSTVFTTPAILGNALGSLPATMSTANCAPLARLLMAPAMSGGAMPLLQAAMAPAPNAAAPCTRADSCPADSLPVARPRLFILSSPCDMRLLCVKDCMLGLDKKLFTLVTPPLPDHTAGLARTLVKSAPGVVLINCCTVPGLRNPCCSSCWGVSPNLPTPLSRLMTLAAWPTAALACASIPLTCAGAMLPMALVAAPPAEPSCCSTCAGDTACPALATNPLTAAAVGTGRLPNPATALCAWLAALPSPAKD